MVELGGVRFWAAAGGPQRGKPYKSSGIEQMVELGKGRGFRLGGGAPRESRGEIAANLWFSSVSAFSAHSEGVSTPQVRENGPGNVRGISAEWWGKGEERDAIPFILRPLDPVHSAGCISDVTGCGKRGKPYKSSGIEQMVELGEVRFWVAAGSHSVRKPYKPSGIQQMVELGGVRFWAAAGGPQRGKPYKSSGIEQMVELGEVRFWVAAGSHSVRNPYKPSGIQQMVELGGVRCCLECQEGGCGRRGVPPRQASPPRGTPPL